MQYAVKAKITEETEIGTIFKVLVPGEAVSEETRKYAIKGVLSGELRIDDGRTISADQRKKAYATLRDCADYLGYPAEEMKGLLKFDYIAATGDRNFSLSDCSVTTARQFISHILDFALQHGVELTEPLIDRCDDIDAAIYATLRRKKCVICGSSNTELHHAEDRVGMGRNRDEIIHLGMRVMCLCRKHHSECHNQGQLAFNKKWKVYGIKADETICETWGLKYVIH